MQAAKIGRLVSERHLHKFAVVLFVLAGIVTFRTGSPVERKGEPQSFLPMWVVHTTVMACFLGMFLTPVYSLTDKIRQAPLRHVAYAAATEQVTFLAILSLSFCLNLFVF